MCQVTYLGLAFNACAGSTTKWNYTYIYSVFSCICEGSEVLCICNGHTSIHGTNTPNAGDDLIVFFHLFIAFNYIHNFHLQLTYILFVCF
ncbi:hypothetical protein D3C71_1883860 [compost metagenome]